MTVASMAGAIALAIVAVGARPCVAGDVPVIPDQVQAQPVTGAARGTGANASAPAQLGGIGNGSQVLEIPLPEKFRGCWVGQVAVLDSERQFSSRWPAVKWSPKRYQVCFVERGLGLWQFTYGESHVDSENSNGFERAQSVKFIRIEGSTAVLRATLVLGSRPSGKYVTHEETTLRCELADGSGGMGVTGDMVADVDGEPWREATWHADFASDSTTDFVK